MFGDDQPVILHLLDIPPCATVLSGVVMELDDCAYPLLRGNEQKKKKTKAKKKTSLCGKASVDKLSNLKF